jgi:hypothetical protein
MPRGRIDVARVIEVLDAVVDAKPKGFDVRVARSRDLGGRYAEHGEPCCLVGVLLIEFGATVATLKGLDREAKWIQESTHPYWRRFEPKALELLAFVQRQNDGGESWTRSRDLAFTGRTYWRDRLTGQESYYAERVFPGPWCTAENVRIWR